MKFLTILLTLMIVGCCNCKQNDYKEVEEFNAFLKNNSLDYSQLKECINLSKNIKLNGCKFEISSNGTTRVILP